VLGKENFETGQSARRKPARNAGKKAHKTRPERERERERGAHMSSVFKPMSPPRRGVDADEDDFSPTAIASSANVVINTTRQQQQETFLHGSTCVVWEGELYTYGGLGEYGEFVDSITRWSGRGESREVTPQNKNMKTDVPPGRYGHTATMSGDYMYVFGGQGRYGALNDLWVFDFVRAMWSPLDAIGEAPRERFGHCACVSENVLFIFGGKDARPGMNVESFDDLYGFDIAEREWLLIESRYGRPSGGEGCALTAVDSVLHVLSPSMPSSSTTTGGSQLSHSMQNMHSSSSMSGLITVDETQSAAHLTGSSSQQQIEQSLSASRRSSVESLGSSNMDVGMSVWILEGGQTSSDGKAKQPRWTKVAHQNESEVPSSRTSYVASKFGNNWIVHGGRSLSDDGNVVVLGDAYCFHFPTGEWARLDPIADTDPRFGHCGACIDGALVMFHGARSSSSKVSDKDVDPCIAINLEALLPFPLGEDEEEQFLVDREAENYAHWNSGVASSGQSEFGGTFLSGGGVLAGGDNSEMNYSFNENETTGSFSEDLDESFERGGSFAASRSAALEAKVLAQLNSKGITNRSGGHFGQSLHAPKCGYHEVGDVEFVIDDIKVHAHADVLSEHSDYLRRVLNASEVGMALNREVEVVAKLKEKGSLLNGIIAAMIQILYFIIVAFSFGLKKFVTPKERMNVKIIVLRDVQAPVLIATLRWIYEIPVQPSQEILADVYRLAIKFGIDGLPNYCLHRLRTEMNPYLAASAARLAYEIRDLTLWQAAVRCAQGDWAGVSQSEEFINLRLSKPSIAKEYALSSHQSIEIPGHLSFARRHANKK